MDHSNEYKVVSNGQEYLFNVLKDLTEPCPQCGVPACGKENYFWVEKAGERLTLILDGAYLDIIIDEYFNVNFTKVVYASLPVFFRAYNEAIGWSEADDFNGMAIDVDDLLTAINMIQFDELEDWVQGFGKEYLHELRKMAHKAIELDTELYVTRS